MSSWTSSDTCGASAPEVQEGQILFGSSSGYSVLEFIGEGWFGKVAKCQKLVTKETVAVKILKEDTDITQDTEKEVSMLKAVSVLNPDHVVKFFERFEHMGKTCLAFEMLDKSLYDQLQERNWEPLSLTEIRPIAKQLFVALDALKGLGILHTDIKPDNIMFVDTQDQPFKVKLIDFGAAIPVSNVQLGMELQPAGYRAPEVALGLPVTEAIDVWGVGCVLAFLYLAENLFPVDCDYQMMKSMVEVLGQPDEHMLRAGIYTQYFFSEEKAADGPTWRLMTPKEYTVANNVKPKKRDSYIELPSSLDDLVNIYPKGEAAEFKDRSAFVYLMKWLLHLDGDQRISPRQALLHPFITLSHLTDHPDSRAYLTTSQIMMSVCPVESSADRVNTSAATAAGFCAQGLPSGYRDDVPGTRPCDISPTTWSSDRVTFIYSYDEDPAAWSSDRDQARDSCEVIPSPASFNGGPLSVSYDEDTAAWSCDEAGPTDLSTTTSASSVLTKILLNRFSRFFSQITATFCCCWRPHVED